MTFLNYPKIALNDQNWAHHLYITEVQQHTPTSNADISTTATTCLAIPLTTITIVATGDTIRDLRTGLPFPLTPVFS